MPFRSDGGTSGAPFFPVPFSLPPVAVSLELLAASGHTSSPVLPVSMPGVGCRRDEQSEPIDLSMKSKSSSRSSSESPRHRIDSSSPLLADASHDADQQLSLLTPMATKTVPLDLSTFVRSKALSG
uniref:Uncharacterized protein n=1 Tax=Anopheles albimanus TaxID=7167 RepID=A0A182FM42_ANOAL